MRKSSKKESSTKSSEWNTCEECQGKVINKISKKKEMTKEFKEIRRTEEITDKKSKEESEVTERHIIWILRKKEMWKKFTNLYFFS